MQYTILKQHDSDRLVEEVSKYLQEGWKPLGGVVVVVPVLDGSPAPMYVQTMIRGGQ